MKRVVITRSNPIDPDSRVEKEANSLKKMGNEVYLVVWDRTSNHKMKKDLKQLENYKVKRISFGAKATYGAGIKSIIPYLKFQINLFMWLIKNKRKYDICHFCDFDTAFLGSLACFWTNKKYIFDIFDYLSTDAKTIKEKIIEKLENNIINRAETTIICSEQRKTQIKKSRPKSLVVIHNTPSNIPVLKENLSKKEKVKIAYIGILQDFRLLKEMVEIVSEMKNVELHIGGFGKYEDYMRNAARQHSNIKFYGKLQYEETLRLENSCDLMTAIYDPSIGNHKYAAPNKFYEALFLGKPLIMVKETGMSDIVKSEDIGVLIEYSSEGFRDGVKSLINRRDEWEKMSDKMKKIYLEKYSWNEMEKRLQELYLRFDN